MSKNNKVRWIGIAITVFCIFATDVKAASITLRPNANGSTTQLSRNTGSANWQMVDESSSDGDSTYVYTTARGAYKKDLYNLPNPASAGTINNVRVWIRARKESNTDPSSYARTELKSGTTTDNSNGLALTTSYVATSKLYTTDPNTGSAWTWSAINDLEIGVGMVTTIGYFQARCTQVWVVIDYEVLPPTSKKIWID